MLRKVLGTSLAVLLSLSCSCSVWLASESFTSAVNAKNEIAASKCLFKSKRPTVALALGGGGIRGVSHIGVLRVLENENIPVDHIVGTSMGAVIGALYCAGVPLDDIEELFEDRSIYRAFAPRPICVQVLLQPVFKLVHLFTGTPPAGLYSGRAVEKFMNRELPEGKREFKDLDIDFRAVVSDICSGKTFSLHEGSVSKAVRASATVPMFLRPVRLGDKLLVDGGLRSSMPVTEALETNADIVLGVLANDPETDPDKPERFKSYLPIFDQTANTVMLEFSKYDMRKADLTIAPELSKISMFDRNPENLKRAIKSGEDAAKKIVPELKRLIDQKSEFLSSNTNN